MLGLPRRVPFFGWLQSALRVLSWLSTNTGDASAPGPLLGQEASEEGLEGDRSSRDGLDAADDSSEGPQQRPLGTRVSAQPGYDPSPTTRAHGHDHGHHGDAADSPSAEADQDHDVPDDADAQSNTVSDSDFKRAARMRKLAALLGGIMVSW